MFGTRALFGTAALSFILAPVFAQHPMSQELPDPEKVEVPGTGVTVLMLDLGGRPVVNVLLNGKGPYPFILDTGATVVAVDPDLQAELALPPQPDAPPGISRLDQLGVGGAILQGVVVVPAPHMPGLVGDVTPRGILGASFFPGYLLTLDYPGRKILIRKDELPSADHRRVFQYDAGDFIPRISVMIAGKEFRPHVDSGSPAGLTLPLNSEADLPLTAKPVQKGRARTPSGEYPVFSAELSEPVQIGEYTLSSRRISLSDVAPGPEPPVGNIGFEVLQEFVVTLDAKNHRIQFTR